MNNYEEFALRLEMLLKKNGMTQKELAEKMFVSPSQISGWKNGTKRINSDHLAKMAEILGVTMDYLWSGKESTNNIVDNDDSNEVEAPANMINTEIAVEAAFDRIAENRKRTIMVQSLSTVIALVLIIYFGMSGAYAAFNKTPLWSYALLCSTFMGVTSGVNALNATPFPKVRKIMLYMASLFGLVTIALFLGLCISLL